MGINKVGIMKTVINKMLEYFKYRIHNEHPG